MNDRIYNIEKWIIIWKKLLFFPHIKKYIKFLILKKKQVLMLKMNFIY